jgi:hypothetical protein
LVALTALPFCSVACDRADAIETVARGGVGNPKCCSAILTRRSCAEPRLVYAAEHPRGSWAMDTTRNRRERLDVAITERSSHQFITHVQKLRWIGMDSEADEMQRALHAADPHCTVLTGPFDTD